jgi:hypothetical protein
MSVTVYQIPLIQSECQDEKYPHLNVYRTLLCYGGSPKWDEVFWQYFQPVATVETDDLEDCFRIMNLWDEPEKVERLHDHVRSLSVGDIVKKGGRFYMVDSFGFSEIETGWQCAA